MNRTRIIRRFEWAAAGLLIVCSTTFATPGCAPKLRPREYGQVIHDLPKLPGAEKPYPLPELDEPKETSKETAK